MVSSTQADLGVLSIERWHSVFFKRRICEQNKNQYRTDPRSPGVARASTGALGGARARLDAFCGCRRGVVTGCVSGGPIRGCSRIDGQLSIVKI